jgi:hypothetical protein
MKIAMQEGVSFILGHFNEPIFPRRIFTPIHKQIRIDDISEVYRYFKESKFIDCRISAYRYREQWGILLLGQNVEIVFIDLDLNRFKSKQALDRALKKTLKNIKEKLSCPDANPTVLSSGSGGYHVIQPVKSIDLNREDYFTKWSLDPNKECIRFLESYLSNYKADPNHYNNVSFNNCLLRVPGSINSKTKAEVKILQKWNNVRPDIKYLYGDFLAYLVDKNNVKEPSKRRVNNSCNWIEYCNRGRLH